MAHGLNTILKRGMGCKSDGKTGIGSRRIFAPQFKLQVLDSYRNDADCKGNQRATARKYGIHRRQIQKWLQVENNLRNSVVKSKCSSDVIVRPEARKCGLEMALRSAEHRQRDDVCVEAYPGQQRCSETAGHATEGRGEGTRDAVDKRVPDIPQHSSSVAVYATTTTALQSNQRHHHHEWQPMHPLRPGSPDDTSSTRSSHSYSHSHSEIEFYGIGSPSHCSLSPRSPPFVPIPLHPYPVVAATSLPLHIPTPAGPVAVVSPTPFCSSNMSPLPLDFTTHTRRVAPSPDSPRGATFSPAPAPLSPLVQRPPFEQQSDSAAPIDLSLKKPYPRSLASPDLQTQTQAPVPVEAAPRITSPTINNTTVLDSHSHFQSLSHSQSHSHSHTHTQPQIWDLSTKGIKREHDHQDDVITVPTTPTPTSSVPISSQSVTLAASQNRPIKLFKPYLDHVIEECPNDATDIKPVIVTTTMPYIDEHCYSNNNNNVADIKMEYQSFYKDENYHQGNFYSPVNADYYPNGGLHFMDSRLSYEDARYRAIKQRQSYSLDFKLSAIECYYSDAICRGNQRAVASKFKIHRRQVQKWLKQEDQLRQRNDTKPMHIVR